MAATYRMSLNDKTVFSTDMKTVLAVIAGIAGGVWAWSDLKANVADHSRQLTVIQATLGADHDVLKVQGANLDSQSRLLERMDKKLDSLRERSSQKVKGNRLQPAPLRGSHKRILCPIDALPLDSSDNK